ncbi:MAG: TolC family protein, partial [Proteobacteria bacterium]
VRGYDGQITPAAGVLAGSVQAIATPLLTWSLPNLAPARARLDQAGAMERSALANWNVVTLRALREVETALALYDAESRRNAALTSAESEADSYLQRAEARVRLGDAAPLLRIDAQRTLAAARLQRLDSDLAVAQIQVALFRALGGGWKTAQDSPSLAE